MVVTEQILHYKSKVWAIIVLTKLEGSFDLLVDLGQNLSEGRLPKSFVVVAPQSKKGLRKKFIFDDFARSKSKNHHRRSK